MRYGRGSCDGKLWLVMVAAALMSLAAACGDDDSGGDDGEDPDPNGEECPNPGQVEVDCRCSADRPPGVRECEEDGMWSACRCPPERPDNACDFEGQAVRCWPCSGESEGRMTTCGEDLRFDCSCRDGSVPLPRDGG